MSSQTPSTISTDYYWPVDLSDILAPELPEEMIEWVGVGDEVVVLGRYAEYHGYVVDTDPVEQRALVSYYDPDSSSWLTNWWGVNDLALWESYLAVTQDTPESVS